jgi:hypothetical protein
MDDLGEPGIPVNLFAGDHRKQHFGTTDLNWWEIKQVVVENHKISLFTNLQRSGFILKEIGICAVISKAGDHLGKIHPFGRP